MEQKVAQKTDNIVERWNTPASLRSLIYRVYLCTYIDITETEYLELEEQCKEYVMRAEKGKSSLKVPTVNQLLKDKLNERVSKVITECKERKAIPDLHNYLTDKRKSFWKFMEQIIGEENMIKLRAEKGLFRKNDYFCVYYMVSDWIDCKEFRKNLLNKCFWEIDLNLALYVKNWIEELMERAEWSLEQKQQVMSVLNKELMIEAIQYNRACDKFVAIAKDLFRENWKELNYAEAIEYLENASRGLREILKTPSKNEG